MILTQRAFTQYAGSICLTSPRNRFLCARSQPARYLGSEPMSIISSCYTRSLLDARSRGHPRWSWRGLRQSANSHKCVLSVSQKSALSLKTEVGSGLPGCFTVQKNDFSYPCLSLIKEAGDIFHCSVVLCGDWHMFCLIQAEYR